ncbi:MULTISPECIES: GNAT family N-acetyltransferase [Streptomyces]|uniref:GNAT family N-acetyltransferase n=1 Tax=Streptomyces TaxID=1883 RepID=UPI0022495B1E|nr:GNAT family N-acetyltransferase [Streptomyces sp. JHD 1]MCX2971190.1 GNAT family N-acetyltransferase [Streptomyces sp. JHD 1]
MPGGEVTYELYAERDAALPQLAVFLPAYAEVYAEAPYCEGPGDVAEFADHYRRHTLRAGMRLVLARQGAEVVGFAYGYPLPSETRWWANVREPLAEDFVREDGSRTWAMLELAVRRPWRRRGVAARMHGRLLQGSGAERATLTVRPEPEAVAARVAYGRWGYRRVGMARPGPGAPLYEAMVLDLD